MMDGKIKKIALSIVLGFSIIFSWLQPLDTSAITQVDAGLKRALIAFAVARTMNAVISVVQETEVSVQFGVGATFAPGQMLDPANDLIEQFGDLMLAASVGFGVMKILIQIGGFWFFSLMLTISAAAWLWLRWRNDAVPDWLMKAVIVLLFVRFSIPVVMIGSDFAFKQFMEPEFNQSLNAIKVSSEEINKSGKELSQYKESKEEAKATEGIKEVAPTEPQQEASAENVTLGTVQPEVTQSEEPSFLVKVYRKAKSTINTVSNAKHAMEIKLENLKQSADRLVEHVVKLIVIFIMQTIIIPVVFLWVLYKLGSGAFRSAVGAKASTGAAS